MRRRLWTIGTIAAALVALAPPASAAPFPGPPPGGTLQPLELTFPDSTGVWVVQHFGSSPWTLELSRAAAATGACGPRAARSPASSRSARPRPPG